jgi:hypothetical protein
MELSSYWNGFLKLFFINLFFQRTSKPTSKSNNTILKLRTNQESRAHDLCEHSQLFKKTAQRAFTWHLQEFTIISNDEAKVIRMIHIQGLDDSLDITEKRGKNIYDHVHFRSLLLSNRRALLAHLPADSACAKWFSMVRVNSPIDRC